MDILKNIENWWKLLGGNPEVNYYKQRGMSENEAQRMVETHQLPSEPDEDINNNQRGER